MGAGRLREQPETDPSKAPTTIQWFTTLMLGVGYSTSGGKKGQMPTPNVTKFNPEYFLIFDANALGSGKWELRLLLIANADNRLRMRSSERKVGMLDRLKLTEG